MKINAVGYNYIHTNGFAINRPNGSDDYVLILLRSKAVFNICGQDKAIPSQSFLLYKKGTPQSYRADGDIFINDFVHFNMTSEEEKNAEDMGIPFDTPITCGEITFLSDIVKNMYQEKYSANPHKEKTLSIYLELIMLKLAEKLTASSLQTPLPYYEKMVELRARVYNEPCEEWSVKAMAQELSLSESYFQHLYRRIFGVSVFSDVIGSRVRRAEYLLFSTDYGISSICVECGYKNETHFMRQFKKETGYTPSEYRNSHLFFYKDPRKRFS
ncbi:MAG: helix-turn-helix transcriptional regulator [Clostridia bacterium]|nr:helix-turn-helix transcriptional regulator [Clostridia bacterium]